MADPATSIIIPTHDRDRDMGLAVCSALGQTTHDIEVIVIDDASQDHTRDVLDILQKYDERLRVIRLPFALGISGGLQRNEGVKVAKGKYICYLDDDDVMTPWSVEKRVEVLEAREDLDYCWGRTMFIRNAGPDWKHLVHERLVAEPKIGKDIPWQIGTIIPDDLMHRAGVVGTKSGIWWTPGRGEDQRLLMDLTRAGYTGAPVDWLVAIYGRGGAFSTTHTADKAQRARLQRLERERLADAGGAVDPTKVERPQPAHTRLPGRFSDRLAVRNARKLNATTTTPTPPPPPRLMQERTPGGPPVPEVQRGDEAADLRQADEVEM